tara:strand:+ start:326 stop:589 length:264 start_codon:yes stop_codon:yes gene_type:complete
MKSYKKFFFKYTLILLFLVFFVNTITTVAQQSVRKIIESDRFFLFLMKNTMLNLDKLSEYKPTDENKLKFNKTLEKIYKNWQLDSKP